MIQPEFLHEEQPPTRGKLRVAETFVSRQGEGKLTGTESFFIRTSGCNLRCHFCDTPYASWQPEGLTYSIEPLVDAARETGLRYVVLTGGEPLLARAAPKLCHTLRNAGIHVTIETAGTLDVSIECDLLSLSPKLRSSAPDPSRHARWHALHEARRMPLPTMRRLIDRALDCQLKFVVESSDNMEEIQHVVAQLGAAPEDVWIMPEGTTAEALNDKRRWLQRRAESFGYQYCDRMQIHWFGNRRGT